MPPGTASSRAAQHLGNSPEGLGPPEAPAPHSKSCTQPCRAALLHWCHTWQRALHFRGRGREGKETISIHADFSLASRGSVPRQGWLQNLVRRKQRNLTKSFSSRCFRKTALPKTALPKTALPKTAAPGWLFCSTLVQALFSPSCQQCPDLWLFVLPAWGPRAAPAPRQHPFPALTLSLVSPG